MDVTLIEKTKPDFNLIGMLYAREKTREAMHRIATQIHPGMTEEEAGKIGEIVLREMGSERTWHRTWIRFGRNTLLPYGELSNPHTKLDKNDIFFIDLGPVWNGYEGDAGATYLVGNHKEMRRCVEDAQKIFSLTKHYWEHEHPTGQNLYQYASEITRKFGWQLNLKQSDGHRLSDFPHALYYKGNIANLDFTPSRYLWVLEIQIRHLQLPFGAFFEDLLV